MSRPLFRPRISSAASLPPAVRERIGYLAEGHHLYPNMRINEHRNFVRRFYPRWSDTDFQKLMGYFELDQRSKIKHLSRGQQAQVALALTLAPAPELLIMDDPTLGLDPAVRREFLESMITLIQQEGRTVLFSSHILSDVERVADRIGIIEAGTLLVDCPATELKELVKKVRLEKSAATAALFQALGGGWWNRDIPSNGVSRR